MYACIYLIFIYFYPFVSCDYGYTLLHFCFYHLHFCICCCCFFCVCFNYLASHFGHRVNPENLENLGKTQE